MAAERQDTVTRRGPIAWMAHNTVAANLLMMLFVVGGLLTFRGIKQEVFPDFELDLVRVSVAYPGASPEEVEQGIVLVLEEALRGVDGIDRVASRASEGAGVVTGELLLSADAQKTYQDVQQEVDRIRTFPEEAERPQVNLVSRRRGVVTFVLHGDQTERVLYNLAEQVRNELLLHPEITQVELGGVRDQEISVSIPEATLRAYGLTLRDVADAIASSSVDLPGGGVKTRGGEILLRVKDRRDWAREFATLAVLGVADGSPVRLGEIAAVREAFEDVDRFATYNGQRAMEIEVFRIGEQKPTVVADAALEVMDRLNAELPPGVRLAVLRDMSAIYRQRAHLLLRNGAIGLVLVLLLLGAFLEIRLAFWVAMGIPISFLGGMLFQPALDVSINMISMFAYLIALGIVVDDAIVVGENVYEYHQRGVPFHKAAVMGAREVAMPVTFSVLTNIVAFLPLMFVPGFIGKIWRVIPLVVMTVFAISLIECLFILPAHLGHGKNRRTRAGAWLHERQQRFSRAFMAGVERLYGPVLEGVLRHRYLTLSCALAALIVIVGLLLSQRIGLEAMPQVEADFAVVTAALPYGSPVELTERVGARLKRKARELGRDITEQDPRSRKQVTGLYAEVGEDFRGLAGGHVVEVRAYLADADERPVSTAEFTRRWKERVGVIPGVEAMLFEANRGGPGGGASLRLNLTHSDSAVLDAASRDMAEILETFPIVSDIDRGYSPGKQQLDFRILPAGRELGLTSRMVARQVRDAFYGAEALRQQRGRNEIRVRVRRPEGERVSEADIETLLVRTPAGTDVPLYEVADVQRGRAYTSIDREEGRRVITVSANVTPSSEAERILDSVLNDYFPQLKDKYPGLGYDFSGRQKDLREGMGALKLGFAAALLMIFALLAIPFGSYTQPLIIMASIPFGVVGAVLGHMIMGYSLSLMSMMGVVALAGVVVNDSLVLIDFANRRCREGMPPHEAMHQAGVRRFRPVILTTLTTFGGLAPMIFETSRQARFMIPMAISLGFGILFATFITLAVVPALYLVREDLARLARRAGGNPPGQAVQG